MADQVRTQAIAMALFALAGCSARNDDTAAAGAAVIEAEDRIDITRGEHIVIPQHTTWTIDRDGTDARYRVIGYGDSIFAGYKAAAYEVARRQAVNVAGEYLAQAWSANVEVVVRALSGAVSSEIVERMKAETSYMTEGTPTRAVYFEMCGNDYLKARGAWAFLPGECDYAPLDAAVDGCAANMAEAMDIINASAPKGATKTIVNLYYPGFKSDGDNRSFCRDSTLGRRPNVQDVLLPRMARSNWRACDLARQKGLACVDAFAEFMAADVDTNGDGLIDSEAIRFRPGEPEAAYVERISVTLRSTLRDARNKRVAAKSDAVYIQAADDVHPTYHLGILPLDPDTGSVVGHGPPDFLDANVVQGKNPRWNLNGHERMGWAMSQVRSVVPPGASGR